jgi:hypothetical protein
MAILIECMCGKTLRIREENAGKRVKCSECGETHKVPAAAEGNPAPTQNLAAEDFEEAPAPRPRIGGESKRAPKKRAASPVFAVLAIGLAFLLLASLLAGGWFFLEALALQGRLVILEKKAADLSARALDAQQQIAAAEERARIASEKLEALMKLPPSLPPDNPKTAQIKEKFPELKKTPMPARFDFLGTWESKLADGSTIGLLFNGQTKLVAVSMISPTGGFAVGGVPFEFDAANDEITIQSLVGEVAKARQTLDGALVVSGSFRTSNLNFTLPQTRFHRVKLSPSAKEPPPEPAGTPPLGQPPPTGL